MEIEENAGKGTHKVIIDLMKNKKRGKVLDIASGKGNLSYNLKNMGFDVIAADINPIDFKPEGIECLMIDANEKLPFETKSFDFVISVETIEHLKKPWDFIDEVHRVLKPKGTFIVTSPNVETIQNRLFFLLSGKLNWFQPQCLDDHKTPIFSWIFEYMVRDKFKIKNVTYNDGELIGFLPRIGIYIRPIKLKNRLFGEIRIFEMKKK